MEDVLILTRINIQNFERMVVVFTDLFVVAVECSVNVIDVSLLKYLVTRSPWTAENVSPE